MGRACQRFSRSGGVARIRSPEPAGPSPPGQREGRGRSSVPHRRNEIGSSGRFRPGAQRKRSRSRSRTSARAGVGSPLHASPRTCTAGTPLSALTGDEVGSRGDLVGEAGQRHLQRLAEEVRGATQIDERGQSRRADRDARHPVPPRPAHAVADDYREAASEARFEGAMERRRARVRIAVAPRVSPYSASCVAGATAPPRG